jgi:hypothetical protein
MPWEEEVTSSGPFESKNHVYDWLFGTFGRSVGNIPMKRSDKNKETKRYQEAWMA